MSLSNFCSQGRSNQKGVRPNQNPKPSGHATNPANTALARKSAPIPACNAQFNHLLEERGRIAEELGRMEAYLKEAPAGQHGDEAAAAFMRSCAYIDEEAARKIGAARP